MNVAITPMPLSGPLFNGAISVYGAAFAPPPYSDPGRGVEVRQRILEVHSARPGFRGFVATGERSNVLGMIYGYHGLPGQWWHDAVVRAVDRDTASSWFGDSYELVEVAVHPSAQGQGIGAMLIKELLDGRSEATSVLSTRKDSQAHFLYRRLGFEVVNEMRFSTDGALFYVMGTRLPLPVESTAEGEPEAAVR